MTGGVNLLFASPEEIIAAARTVTAGAAAYQRVVAMLDDPNASVEEVAELARAERSLAARLVRVANSAQFVHFGACSSIEEAMQRMGFNYVVELTLLCLGLESCPNGLRAYGMGRRELWQRIVTGAIAARKVAGRTNVMDNDAYLAALLSTIGLSAIDVWLAKHAPTINFPYAPSFSTWAAAEVRMFGFDYAEVGSAILRSWGMPRHVTDGVRFQNRPSAAGSHETMARIIQAGQLVAEVLCDRNKAGRNVDFGVLKRFSFEDDDIQPLLGSVHRESLRLAHLLGLETEEVEPAPMLKAS